MSKNDLVLRPNCLLTRRPLRFITPRPLSFFYFKPYNEILWILQQHGYQANLAAFNELNNSHVFCDSLTYQKHFDRWTTISNSTVTVISSDFLEIKEGHFLLKLNYPVNNRFYNWHQKLARFFNKKPPKAQEVLIHPSDRAQTQVLNQCIHLAELDFYELDLRS